jgi:hypothetical protein
VLLLRRGQQAPVAGTAAARTLPEILEGAGGNGSRPLLALSVMGLWRREAARLRAAGGASQAQRGRAAQGGGGGGVPARRPGRQQMLEPAADAEGGTFSGSGSCWCAPPRTHQSSSLGQSKAEKPCQWCLSQMKPWCSLQLTWLETWMM